MSRRALAALDSLGTWLATRTQLAGSRR